MLASTFSENGPNPDHIREFANSPADSQVLQGYHFFKVYDDQNVEYVLVTGGGSEDAYMIGKIAVSQIQNLIIAYKERLDKNNFIQKKNEFVDDKPNEVASLTYDYNEMYKDNK